MSPLDVVAILLLAVTSATALVAAVSYIERHVNRAVDDHVKAALTSGPVKDDSFDQWVEEALGIVGATIPQPRKNLDDSGVKEHQV